MLNACDWGYYLSNENKYIPIKTTLPTAPEKLLKVIHCTTNCDSKRCTCRKHGIECSGDVGVLVALIQITLGMRKVKMLTFCKIHVNDLLYFMEKNLGNIC